MKQTRKIQNTREKQKKYSRESADTDQYRGKDI